MPLLYAQDEVETEIADIIKHGDQKKIAAIVGVHSTYIEQQCNPSDERKSWIYQALQFLCAEDDIDAGRGENLWQMMCRFRDLSRKRVKQNLCVGVETGSLNKEVADVVNSHLQGKTFYEQLKELDEVDAQSKRTRSAIMCAIDAERKNISVDYDFTAVQASGLRN